MSEVGWLVVDGHVAAAAEIATSRAERRRGLRGRVDFEGALVLEPCRSVHTLGMRFSIDVAYCDEDGTVLDCRTLSPWRVSWPRWRSRRVVEARAGAFARWGIEPGCRVEVLGVDPDDLEVEP